MKPNLRPLTLMALATIGAGFLAVQFWTPTSDQTPDSLTHAAPRALGDAVDAPASGASQIFSSQIATASVGLNKLPSGKTAAFANHRATASAAVAREQPHSSTGAIKTGKPNRPRPTAPIEPENPVAAAPRRRLIIEAIPATPVPGQPLLSGSVPASELQIDLAPGVKEPIALVDFTSDLPPAQARAVAAIADDFVDRIEKAAESLPDEGFAETWDTEQANADAQYYAIFGVEAYNRKLADTAANAIAGKTVSPNAPKTK